MRRNERPAPGASGSGLSEKSVAAKPLILGSQCIAADPLDPTSTGLQLGRLLREAGAARADDCSDMWWKSCATAAIVHLAALGHPFTADDLRHLQVPEPHNPSQVGALFIGAAKAGVIRSVGYAQSTRPPRHAGVLRVWVGGDA